ncbi:Uncharacterized exopolysaccharide biosynthesis protein-like protein [Methylobacterium sp. 4-46]|uniref:hypothetical protein n=1 Tax=unclassified Methylobacterium TaxID=2615210 RepID=UPI000165CB60|nr:MULTISPECIES: hypothetical protein [Methylobacterium]ACA19297.1 Uncharacterized exopolysaccharide biosynthesis protein-like protein [Methylobacterium sp. 4-46]WFT78499.1 hypothetical protein QA634_24970 [Methylobacterium nodulans]
MAAFVYYSAVGERYEVYTLVRVGQGIKDKNNTGSTLGDSVDLSARLDSIGRIGSTDQVISEALDKVGLQRLTMKGDTTLLGQFRTWLSAAALNGLEAASTYVLSLEAARPVSGLVEQARAFVRETIAKRQRKRDPAQVRAEAVAGLRDLISARQEGRSDLLRISFRFPDPEVAPKFVNALAEALVTVQASLVQIPGADEFFQQQAKRLEEEAHKAASDLKNFSIAASIYSTTEQKALLLKRASELDALIATTRGAIVDRKGQKQAILDQLSLMKPVTQSRTVSAIVGRLGGRDTKTGQGSDPIPAFEEAPPLLLVRVYQDAMANLLKLNSDLNGAVSLEALLQKELTTVNGQLRAITDKEAEYERLKRVLARAASAADFYGNRMMEEQISAASAKKAQLSSIRVVQQADRPTSPLFPQVQQLVLLALAFGFVLGSVIAVFLEMDSFESYDDVDDQLLLSARSGQLPRRIAAE